MKLKSASLAVGIAVAFVLSACGNGGGQQGSAGDEMGIPEDDAAQVEDAPLTQEEWGQMCGIQGYDTENPACFADLEQRYDPVKEADFSFTSDSGTTGTFGFPPVQQPEDEYGARVKAYLNEAGVGDGVVFIEVAVDNTGGIEPFMMDSLSVVTSDGEEVESRDLSDLIGEAQDAVTTDDTEFYNRGVDLYNEEPDNDINVGVKRTIVLPFEESPSDAAYIYVNSGYAPFEAFPVP